MALGRIRRLYRVFLPYINSSDTPEKKAAVEG
jgi:hypothetical protein